MQILTYQFVYQLQGYLLAICIEADSYQINSLSTIETATKVKLCVKLHH